MRLFRRKSESATERYGWRIITLHNEALGTTKYRVYRPGFFTTYYSESPISQDFDDYDDALVYYHEMTGWRNVEEVQP